jgi:fructose-specific component phosphotransferase system IIB-like protein
MRKCAFDVVGTALTRSWLMVQVVSEAADTAAKGILHHCHAAKLVPCVCDTVTKDKNAKLRQHCSVYLVQVSISKTHPWQLFALALIYSKGCVCFSPSLRSSGRICRGCHLHVSLDVLQPSLCHQVLMG